MQARSVALAMVACGMIGLNGCAGTPFGDLFRRSVAADPNLTSTPNPGVPPAANVSLPKDFPFQIPQYPGAVLQEVQTAEGEPVTTRWISSDSQDKVLAFYQRELQSGDWKLEPPSGESTQTNLVARQNALRLKVSILARDNGSTELYLQYRQDPNATASASPSPSPDATASPSPTPTTPASQSPQGSPQYLSDLQRLGVLTAASNTKSNAKPADLTPTKGVTRREFARWLAATNNRLFSDRPAQQIRFASEANQPAFKDVSKQDPDFPAIQGLAEAGIIPSPLSGDTAATTFRPDAPLTRETMLLWKVPLDSRQGLPTANVEAVRQSWGFQDADKIDPRALRTIQADFQNGDLSNIRRAFGYTRLFQPKKTVTVAEAAATLWYFGVQNEGLSARDAQGKASEE